MTIHQSQDSVISRSLAGKAAGRVAGHSVRQTGPTLTDTQSSQFVWLSLGLHGGASIYVMGMHKKPAKFVAASLSMAPPFSIPSPRKFYVVCCHY
jgi:hypothetical protein